MANLLYRLGWFAYRRRRLVAAIWAVALVLIAAGAVTLGGRTVDAFAVPETESQQALDDLNGTCPNPAAPRSPSWCGHRPAARSMIRR